MGRGLGSAAVPEVTSNCDRELLCGGATQSSRTWQLLPPTGSCRRLGSYGAVCKGDAAQLGGRPESKKRRVYPRDGLAWSICLAMHLSEVSLSPTTASALPSPAARSQAPSAGQCPGSFAGICGRGWALHLEALGLQVWHYVGFFQSYSPPLAVARPFLLEAFNDFCNRVHKATTFWG